ncbi:hypothetical protein [Novosphingobium sp.]|uniref:hypothetical protein n=1 Tax=Novosphingobium sp. TaxID=1874826 RepID=UPI003B529477
MTTVPQDLIAKPREFDIAPDAPLRADLASALTTGGLIRFFVGSTVAAFTLALTFRPYSNVSAFLLMRQDRWLLLVALGLMALCSLRCPERGDFPRLRLRSWLMVAAVLAVVTSAGHFLILSDYDLSRDEQLASFDASIFMKGHIVQPVTGFWRDHSAALNTTYMYPADHRRAWISAYLPLNSVFRALFGLVGLPYLIGPLMTVLGGFALWGCVGRLWPFDHDAKFVALVLYAGSAQIVFAGMTSYAMPDHLALNLCWLWLFLRKTRASDFGALAVGFFATGLHQPLMHPMFVAPFIALLLFERRWTRACLYIVAYGLISAFWLYWPTWMVSLVQESPDAVGPPGLEYMERLIGAVRNRDPMGLPDMVANFLRFIAWQHLLLVPLLLYGIRQYRQNPMILALAGGLVLIAVFMAIALPDQGHGFGYRYFHGLIGNAILLAIYGWKALDRTGERPGLWRALLMRTTVATVVVLMPIQVVMAHNFYAPAALVSRQIDTINADYVVIGGKDAPFAKDLVLNPPTLLRRPIGLLREKLDAGSIAAICASHPSVALFGDRQLMPISAYFAFGDPVAERFNHIFAPRLASAGCNVVPAD